MLDLTVCVGESCHLSGAEIVLKSFMELIEKEQLQDTVCLKGSFCIGDCDDQSLVSVKVADQVVRTRHQDAEQAFYQSILPVIQKTAINSADHGA